MLRRQALFPEQCSQLGLQRSVSPAGALDACRATSRGSCGAGVRGVQAARLAPTPVGELGGEGSWSEDAQ